MEEKTSLVGALLWFKGAQYFTEIWEDSSKHGRLILPLTLQDQLTQTVDLLLFGSVTGTQLGKTVTEVLLVLDSSCILVLLEDHQILKLKLNPSLTLTVSSTLLLWGAADKITSFLIVESLCGTMTYGCFWKGLSFYSFAHLLTKYSLNSLNRFVLYHTTLQLNSGSVDFFFML